MAKELNYRDIFTDAFKKKLENAILRTKTQKVVSSVVFQDSFASIFPSTLFRFIRGKATLLDTSALSVKFYDIVMATCAKKFNHQGIYIAASYEFAPKKLRPNVDKDMSTYCPIHVFFPDPSMGKVVNPGQLKEGMTGVHVFFCTRSGQFASYELYVSMNNQMKIDKLMIQSSLELGEFTKAAAQKRTACRCAACGLQVMLNC